LIAPGEFIESTDHKERFQMMVPKATEVMKEGEVITHWSLPQKRKMDVQVFAGGHIVITDITTLQCTKKIRRNLLSNKTSIS